MFFVSKIFTGGSSTIKVLEARRPQQVFLPHQPWHGQSSYFTTPRVLIVVKWSEKDTSDQQMHSFFIDNLSSKYICSTIANFEVIINAYVPNEIGRNSGIKYEFTTLKTRVDGEKAIQVSLGQLLGGRTTMQRLVEVMQSLCNGINHVMQLVV